MRINGRVLSYGLLVVILLAFSTASLSAAENTATNVVAVDSYGDSVIVLSIDSNAVKQVAPNVYVLRAQTVPAELYGFSSYLDAMNARPVYVEAADANPGAATLSALKNDASIEAELFVVYSNNVAVVYVVSPVPSEKVATIHETVKNLHPTVSKTIIVSEPVAYETARKDGEALAKAYDEGSLEGDGYTILAIGYTNEVRMPIVAVATENGEVPMDLVEKISAMVQGPILLEVGTGPVDVTPLSTADSGDVGLAGLPILGIIAAIAVAVALSTIYFYRLRGISL